MKKTTKTLIISIIMVVIASSFVTGCTDAEPRTGRVMTVQNI
jgi:hypothetical protein